MVRTISAQNQWRWITRRERMKKLLEMDAPDIVVLAEAKLMVMAGYGEGYVSELAREEEENQQKWDEMMTEEESDDASH